MTEINVNVLYLQNLANRARQVQTDLRQFSALGTEALTSSPVVEGAYRDLSQRWDKRRGELADALGAIAGGLDTCWQTFQQADIDLAAALGAPAACES